MRSKACGNRTEANEAELYSGTAGLGHGAVLPSPVHDATLPTVDFKAESLLHRATAIKLRLLSFKLGRAGSGRRIARLREQLFPLKYRHGGCVYEVLVAFNYFP